MKRHCFQRAIPAAILLALGFFVPGLPAHTLQELPGGEILYSRKEGDRYLVHVMKADGSDSRPLPNQPGTHNVNPTWSRDGKRVLYRQVNTRDARDVRYCVTDADGGNPTLLEGPGPVSGRMCWSPDGKEIAIATHEGEGGVYVKGIASGALRHIEGTKVGAAAPFWRRDGGAIGHTRSGPRGNQSEIAFTRINGTGSEILVSADHAVLSSADSLSPDSKQLIYFEVLGPIGSILVRRLDISERVDTVIHESPPIDFANVPIQAEVCWSPDGKWLAVTLPTGKGPAVFRMQPDGKMVTRLTPEGVDCAGASWRAAR